MVTANPGVRQLSARGGTLIENLAAIDVLTINRSEAGVLVPGLVARYGDNGSTIAPAGGEQLPSLAVRGLAGGGFEMRLTSFFRALHSMGTKYVLVTDGQSGAFLGTGDEVLHCPAIQAKVAGTAGAGDAFASVFSAFLALKRPLERCSGRRLERGRRRILCRHANWPAAQRRHRGAARQHASSLPVRRWPL